MSRRAVAPVVGVVLMLAVVVALAGVVGAFVVGVGGQTEDAPSAVISADLDGNEITLTHQSGESLNVSELTVKIYIDGTPLDYQPDVPAYGSAGFNDLSGPFHAWGDQPWKAGTTASLEIAGNNAPQPSAGSHVTVKFYANGTAVATARA